MSEEVVPEKPLSSSSLQGGSSTGKRKPLSNATGGALALESHTSKRVTRAQATTVQSFIKQENISEGNIQCPVCNVVICVSERGCSVVTCRNHQPQFVYFCAHCKAVTENNTEYSTCKCPRRNDRQTRAQAQSERNLLAKENPIVLEEVPESGTVSVLEEVPESNSKAIMPTNKEPIQHLVTPIPNAEIVKKFFSQLHNLAKERMGFLDDETEKLTKIYPGLLQSKCPETKEGDDGWEDLRGWAGLTPAECIGEITAEMARKLCNLNKLKASVTNKKGGPFGKLRKESLEGPPQRGWICGACTFENPKDFMMCEACETRKPEPPIQGPLRPTWYIGGTGGGAAANATDGKPKKKATNAPKKKTSDNKKGSLKRRLEKGMDRMSPLSKKAKPSSKKLDKDSLMTRLEELEKEMALMSPLSRNRADILASFDDDDDADIAEDPFAAIRAQNKPKALKDNKKGSLTTRLKELEKEMALMSPLSRNRAEILASFDDDDDDDDDIAEDPFAALRAQNKAKPLELSDKNGGRVLVMEKTTALSKTATSSKENKNGGHDFVALVSKKIPRKQLFPSKKRDHTTGPNFKQRPPRRGWACEVCTYTNPKDEIICGACDSAKPES